ncbi:lipopolysaccharide biosynthesis protein [[Phormidium] sp. ETS-05]|uniref:lipopolysaccharide biosynthesis protein n=1 Tax=[Phormidium] sp. ETS-05 TaxID=222819 RepID=UPI0018EF052B|nr:lipopolysaccharide biosynthesis protein [[Phormidium] sp. ETS-05]
MSASKRIAFAVGVSWLSRAVSILANLFLMPILFRYMGKEELGLWFLLGNSQAFLSLLGMGIAPTLTRHIALAKGKSGADPNVELSPESQQHIADLVATGRIILQWLAVGVFFIAWASGYGLISQLELKEVSPQTVFWAWTLMCGGYAVGVWVSYLNCWLAGIGYVGWDSLITTVISILTIVANITAVLLGGGLLELSVIFVLSSLIPRIAIWGFIVWKQPGLLAYKGKWNYENARLLIKPSLYWWLTDLGAFLILRTDAYFIALLRGTEDIPSYQAAYQLVANLYILAISFGKASSVFISQAWQAGNLSTVQRLTLKNAKIGLSIMAAGVAFLSFNGQEVLELWLGSGNFIGNGVIMVFCIMLTLEVQHVILATCSRATEDEKYVASALSAGVLNIIFTWYLIRPLGLIGVALGTMLAQMLTNNWYAVYRPLTRLKISWKLYVNEVIIMVLTLGISCAIASGIWQHILLGLNLDNFIIFIGGSALICSLFLWGTFWQCILDINQRHYLEIRGKKIIKLLPIFPVRPKSKEN